MPIQGENRRVQLLARGFATIFVAAFLLAIMWLVFGPLREIANKNDGFIAAIGIFVVVPLAILSSRLLERARRKQLAATVTNLLIYELWHNLNYVGQIERSYENNFEWFGDIKQPIGMHIPHFGPRISVLEKFVGVEHLVSLNEQQSSGLLEIYAQLCALRDEFPRWRERLPSALESRELYEAYSSTLLSIVDPLMRNMTDMWVNFLAISSFNSRVPQIAHAANLVRSRISQGQILHPTYKASFFKSHPRDFGPQGKIICWRDDWKDAPVEVIDLSDASPLHPSWRPQASKRSPD